MMRGAGNEVPGQDAALGDDQGAGTNLGGAGASPSGALAMNGGLGIGGMNEGFAAWEKFLLQFAEAWNPLTRWIFHPVHAAEHDDTDTSGKEPYGAYLHAPPDFDYHDSFPLASGAQASPATQQTLQAITKGVTDLYPGILDLRTPRQHVPGLLVKAVGLGDAKQKKSTGNLPDGGRWITVHPHHDPDEAGHPIYIVPNPDGSHTVVAGAGGKLNGLRMTGVKSPEEYKRWAGMRRQEKASAKKQFEDARIQQVGMQQYVAEQQAKKQALEETAGVTRDTERDFVAQVLAARGHDASIMDIPPEAIAGLAPQEQERLVAEHHRALVSYANAVADGVENNLVAGYGELMAEGGDLSASDVLGTVVSGRGKGYAAQVEEIAREHGLTEEGAQDAARSVSWRKLLTEHGDAQSAREAQENSAKRQAAGEKAREGTASAAAKLADSGVGPEAVRSLSEEPDEDTMQAAAAILLARRKMQASKQRLSKLRRDIGDVDDVTRLPRAAAVVATPLSDEDAMKQVAQSLGEASQTAAMNELVTTSNALDEHGQLRQHLSVGQNAALNEVMAAALPGGGFVDPLVQDLLGHSVVAHAIARRVSQLGDGDAFKSAITSTHLRTQEGIAREGVEKASEFLAAADEIPDEPVASHPEGMAGALVDLEKKDSLLNRARGAAGVARGRLEAMASLVGAMDGIGAGKDGSVLTNLGAISPLDAIKNLAAAGLTEPSKFDDDGNLLEQGDYTVHHDGVNATAEIHPQGLDKVVGQASQEDQARAASSLAIKRGAQDDPTFHPAGITQRPKTTFDFDPSQFVQIGHVLVLAPGSDGNTVAQSIENHIGARIQEGQDPFDVLSSISSASFVAGLNLDSDGERRYRDTLRSIAPPAPAYGKGASPGEATKLSPGEKAEMARQHREDVRQKLVDLARGYVAAKQASGELSPEDAALDAQHVPITATTHDIAYQAVLADPRTQHGFTKLGDLGRDGREAIRSYANEHLFGLDPKSGEIISPVSPDERQGFERWQELKGQGGDPYGRVQQMWADHAAQDVGLFGDPEIPSLATVDMSSDAAVVAAARQNVQTLGYGPGGHELQPGEVYDTDDNGRPIKVADRTESSIAADAKARIRGVLRKKFFELSGMSTLSETGFNPERVLTASGRWGEYVRQMGGEKRAIETVQEFMRGDVSQRFAAAYGQATGRRLAVANRTVRHADKHAQAMLPPDSRGEVDQSRQLQAIMQKNRSGKFQAGSVADRMDAAREAANTQMQLIDKDEAGPRAARTSRASIGTAAEGALKQLIPGIDLSKPVEAAQGVTFADENGIKTQRAIKLIQANKRLDLAMQAGGGKTLTFLSAFTDLKAQGKVDRHLILAPSSVVDQIGSECYKFIDPAAGITWHADSGSDPGEREAAMADPDRHICVMTPEALRESVTRAVAEDMNSNEAEATSMLERLGDGERDALIHGAMRKRGWNFDMSTHDEGHRLLGRKGKPDSRMAIVGDSVARMTPYFVNSTADTMKNDATEGASLLGKLNPQKYGSKRAKEEFIRRYGRNTLAAGTALQRELEPYRFAASTKIGVEADTQAHVLKMKPQQQAAHDGIIGAYQAARLAKARGGVDVGALKTMMPEKFEGGVDETAVATRMNSALGACRDAALERVIHDPHGVKGDRALELTKKHLAAGDHVCVFANRLHTVHGMAERMKAEGLRVAVLTGEMSGEQKAKARLAFSPPAGTEPSADVMILSDAGAVGLNLQRGNVQIQLDTPDTAMVHEQRIARNWRRGQKRNVQTYDLVADCKSEHTARERLANKSDLRELLTTPSEEIDDSGLLMDLERARMQRAERV
jgi:hypothetical protein